ncbi:MAG: HNH endonuclease [Proteobacteria bacterium]|nr:HNH endonuclease [Pseudomonadota bacterium]
MSCQLGAPVLVLNRNYQPVRITTARRAFTMLFGGTAWALDAQYEPYDFDAWSARPPRGDSAVVGTSSGPLCVPRLLLLLRYSRLPVGRVRLSRRNVFLRDDHTCQYCGRRLVAASLNLDHVTPRSRGGLSSWENLVTSCRPCNLRKGCALPEEAGMRLRDKPTRPRWTAAVQVAALARGFVEWEPFLQALPARSARGD